MMPDLSPFPAKSDAPEHDSAEFWKRRSSLTQQRFNFACWLHLFLRLSLIAAFLFVLVTFFSKRNGFYSQAYWWGFAITCVIIAAIALVLSKKQFLSSAEALLRIEETLGLNNRLSAAMAGVVSWPQAVPKIDDSLRWRKEQILIPVALQAILLAGAQFIPITTEPVFLPHIVEKPVSLAEVETWIEELEEKDIVRPESLATIKQQAEEIAAKPEEEWYDHSTLEAAETLREKMENGQSALLRGLNQAENTLSELAQNNLTQSELNEFAAQLKDNLQNLESGTFPLNEHLLNPLTELEAKGFKNFSKEELAQLKEGLRESIGSLEGMNQSPRGNKDLAKKGGKNGNTDGSAGKLSEDQGNCSGDSSSAGPMCSAEGKLGQGEGGITRGPGHVPLDLNEKPPQLTSQRDEEISGSETDDEPGELIGLGAKAPTVDQSIGVKNETSTTAVGKGGSDVLRGDFTPREQHVLKKYFQEHEIK